MYLYQNKVLLDLPGEEWRDITGLEGAFQVSNLGRVRSLGRFVPHRWGKPIWVESRILSQSHRFDKNLKTGEPTVALRIGVGFGGQRYDLTVRRLVYTAFVGPIPEGWVVLNRDGDGFNNRVENLQLATRSQKGKRVVERGRGTFSLAYLDRSKFPKKFGGYSRQKAIAQYDLAGNLVATFESIAEAVRQTEHKEKSIIWVAKGRWKHHHGFVWRYL